MIANGSGAGDDLVYGRNPVMSLLEGGGDCLKVLISRRRSDPVRERIVEICRARGIPFQEVDGKVLDRMVGTSSHQGVVARVSPVGILKLEDLYRLAGASDPVAAFALLVVDHVEDPHNLGAMIRTAEAAGFSAVLFPSRREALPTGVVVKASAGAALRVPLIMVGNVSQAIRRVKEDLGLWAVGLEAQGRASVFDERLPPRIALVVGSEGKGLSRVASAACDDILMIPMMGASGSLNVSVAAGIVMYQWYQGNLIG
ncbi:RNA methyltransferase, TrmH family, group 3 [Thermanaerovibrio acidaminovorans DSM 6589]|uniref:RNA methyltransferase, TrmH family, group 3 n=1 Tax=Thermanaerovibrio acidaminovorans (strain ATCC 49978 / DSM 6589 / Su883) TaxID=525903 RepID=D1B9Y1_THEAS|nr:23S rRNA (guanosine(2251)-2'-O)-methyltransferase RlmB [Thermanaerovibrio acidaminovorans]ACZ19084.1 RNA methyltransferase, TrmH family, group 3 [Thermanaerovibrio acidaminovorans DSM 6589]